MAHEVETMFSVREVPWHGLGTILTEAPNSIAALKLAGLDWEVRSEPVYWNYEYKNDPLQRQKQIRIPGKFANIRSDNVALGVVGKNYKILQNHEAFSFADQLVGMVGEIKYETAGSLCGGKKVWMLMEIPGSSILGEKYKMYLCMVNTFDGQGAIRVVKTPVRVVCKNTVDLALASASRTWTTRHLGNMSQKLDAARNLLDTTDIYMKALADHAEKEVKIELTRKQAEQFIASLFKGKDEAAARAKATMERAEEDLRQRFFLAPDIENYRFTRWGMTQALTDSVSHLAPLRNTPTVKQNKMLNIVDGNRWLNSALKKLELVY